jgi:hypothetical protein
MAVDHVPGARYLDAWHDQPLTPQQAGGKAAISLELGPLEVGCVVQENDVRPADDR